MLHVSAYMAETLKQEKWKMGKTCRKWLFFDHFVQISYSFNHHFGRVCTKRATKCYKIVNVHFGNIKSGVPDCTCLVPDWRAAGGSCSFSCKKWGAGCTILALFGLKTAQNVHFSTFSIKKCKRNCIFQGQKNKFWIFLGWGCTIWQPLFRFTKLACPIWYLAAARRRNDNLSHILGGMFMG